MASLGNLPERNALTRVQEEARKADVEWQLASKASTTALIELAQKTKDHAKEKNNPATSAYALATAKDNSKKASKTLKEKNKARKAANKAVKKAQKALNKAEKASSRKK